MDEAFEKIKDIKYLWKIRAIKRLSVSGLMEKEWMLENISIIYHLSWYLFSTN